MAVLQSINTALANMASIFEGVSNVSEVRFYGKADGKEPQFDHSYSATEIPDGKVLIELIENGGVPDYTITSTTDYPHDIDVRLLHRVSATKFGNNGTTDNEARTIMEAIFDALRDDPQLKNGGSETCMNTTITNIQPPFDIGKNLALRMFTVRTEIRRET